MRCGRPDVDAGDECGAAGAVVHGFHRDSNEIERLGFPVASFGSYAQDQGVRGKVVDWRIPIEVMAYACAMATSFSATATGF